MIHTMLALPSFTFARLLLLCIQPWLAHNVKGVVRGKCLGTVLLEGFMYH